jgi:hypothetical protein
VTVDPDSLQYVIRSAAQKWLDELGDYVIPDCDPSEEAAYQQEYDELNEALIEYDRHRLVQKEADNAAT